MTKIKTIFGKSIYIPLLLLYVSVEAQDTTSNKYGKGIEIVAADNSFSMSFSARFQTLYEGIKNLETDEYVDALMIRRSRLKFDGHAYSEKLEYKIELGLSNRDIGSGADQFGDASNIILDAVLKYNFYGKWTLWFGQTKLPSNIERVISSQQLQLVDRSIVNSRYNIDRDVGFQLHYESETFRGIGAISMGEGRNVTADNNGGHCYTGRVEWMPLGKFEGKAYSGSDHKRESSPKLLIGATYDYNDQAGRTRGQLGSFVLPGAERSLSTLFLDAHFKYQGFSLMTEYANKQAPDGFETLDEDGDPDEYFVGTGLNVQAGYLFKSNFEVAGRYSIVTPETGVGNENTQYTFGVSKYIVGHSLKVQSDLTWNEAEGSDDELIYRFQVELAF